MDFFFQENFDVLSLNTGYTVTGNKIFQGENQQAFDNSVKNAVKSKFENVDRLVCRGDQYKNMELLLDINSAIYPVRTGDKLEGLLTLTLNPKVLLKMNRYHEYDGTLINDFDYVMHGIIFKIDYLDNEKANARMQFMLLLSLLMKLVAEQRKCHILN